MSNFFSRSVLFGLLQARKVCIVAHNCMPTTWGHGLRQGSYGQEKSGKIVSFSPMVRKSQEKSGKVRKKSGNDILLAYMIFENHIFLPKLGQSGGFKEVKFKKILNHGEWITIRI